MKITMLGSGAWGTALANLLCENGHQVTLWSRSAEKAAAMEESRVNPRLQGVPLHPSLHVSSSLQAVGESEMVVFATPSFAIAETARLVRDLLPQDAILVSVTKGIEAETGLRMTEILRRETGRAAVALSGPSHAEEVSRHLPTGCVAACEDGALAEAVQDVFMGDYFRVYASVDVVGVELSAAMKNVIALCAGDSPNPRVREILEDVLATPVSPELLPTDESGAIVQKTEEILGDYEVHDFFLYYFIKYGFSPKKLLFYAKNAFDDRYGEERLRGWLKLFLRRFAGGQFKRSAAPEAAAITDFGLSSADFILPSDMSVRTLLKELDD